jgi:hypothetical protein
VLQPGGSWTVYVLLWNSYYGDTDKSALELWSNVKNALAAQPEQFPHATNIYWLLIKSGRVRMDGGVDPPHRVGIARGRVDEAASYLHHVERTTGRRDSWKLLAAVI